MHDIKADMREVLKLSMTFWRDFTNFNGADFFTFKKDLEVFFADPGRHQLEVSNSREVEKS